MKRFTANVNFPDENAEKAWLMKTAINKCRDMFRSLTYKYFYFSVSLDEAELICETPEESTVYHAVMELPPKYRLVIHLYYYEGYKAAEIGQMIGRSETAVLTRLSRARKKLRDLLGKDVIL